MKNKKCVSGLIAGVVLACVGYCLSISNVEAQPRYNMTFLPGLEKGFYPTDLNNLGEVTGVAPFLDTCFLYSNGTVKTWGMEGAICAARAINDGSQVVGTFIGTYDNYAFSYLNGEITYLGGLPTENVTSESNAYDINNAGQIVGEYSGGNLDGPVVFWQGNIMEIGTNGFACGINDNYGSNGLGQIVGTELTATVSGARGAAFAYSNGIITFFSICCPEGYTDGECGGVGNSINNVGQVVGQCILYGGGTDCQSFLYNIEDQSHSFIGLCSTVAPLDINDAGQVIGAYQIAGPEHIFPILYTNGLSYNLYDLISPNFNLYGLGLDPTAINNRGQIVANTNQGVVLLTPITLPPAYSIVALPLAVTGLNNLGDVVGYSNAEGNQHGFVHYANGTTVDLGTLGGATSIATAINDEQQIAGSSLNEAGETHAFLYENGGMTDLGTLVGEAGTSYANAINNAGQIVGQSASSNSSTNAVLFWEGKLIDMGLLKGNSGNSVANSINDIYDSNGIGQAVGQSTYSEKDTFRAFIYSNDKMMDIGINACSSYTGSSLATSINKAGKIVGYCIHNRGEKAPIFVYDSEDKISYEIGALPKNMTSSTPLVINDVGQIVGMFTNGTAEFPFFVTDGALYNLYDYIPSSAGITGLVPVAINNLGQIAANSDQGGVLLIVGNGE